MIITADIAFRIGYYGYAVVDGVSYFRDAFRAKYSFDGNIIYFNALPLGSDIQVKQVDHLLLEDEWYIGYPKKKNGDSFPDEKNSSLYHWTDIYDAKKPFLWKG